MGKHSGQTDKAHQIELPSSIERVQWADLRAAPGGTVGLEIATSYVSSGSVLQIKLSDHQGTTHGTFENEIHNNHLSAEVQVPPKAKDALYAEVKFPDHGLKQKSPALLLTPPVKVRNAKWDKEQTFEGALHTLTAEVKGLPDGSEVAISVWEQDPENNHELLTRFPAWLNNGRVEAEWEFSYDGLLDSVLAALESDVSGPKFFFKVEAYGIEATSDPIEVTWLFIELVGEDGAPVAGERYRLTLPDGSVREGDLGADGRAFLYDIESSGECKLTFPDLDKEAWESI